MSTSNKYDHYAVKAKTAEFVSEEISDSQLTGAAFADLSLCSLRVSLRDKAKATETKHEFSVILSDPFGAIFFLKFDLGPIIARLKLWPASVERYFILK
jgi:hypothetical protein